VRAEGLVYLEAPAEWRDPALAAYGLVALRHLRAGAVHAHLLQRTA
jgi:16S rRNA (guanine966-N2)-methyltransferase